MKKQTYIFEPLNERHDCASFSCGIESLDRYFQGDPVRQDLGRRTSVVFVMTPDGVSVSGFYTLSYLSILGVELPEKLAKKLPGRPVGATLLGRMGIHKELQGHGLGELLLMDSLYRFLQASKQVASWAVVVDAKEEALPFYLKYQFVPLPSSPNRLLLPMKTIEKLF